MKITKNQLRQIIQEELAAALYEEGVWGGVKVIGAAVAERIRRPAETS